MDTHQPTLKGVNEDESTDGDDAVIDQLENQEQHDDHRHGHHHHDLNECLDHVDHEGKADLRDYLHAQREIMKSTRKSIVLQHHPDARASLIMRGLPVIASQREVGAAEDEDDDDDDQRKKRLKHIAKVGRRSTLMQNNAEWRSVLGKLGELEEEEEDEAGNEDHDHDSIPWYSPPYQRQLWGDETSLPHINWGDLFFDLFYVAAAYNLGVMLISAMNSNDWPRGVIYFVGIFGPLYNIWESDLSYSSRYTVVDWSHRFVSVVRFFFVAFAVLHIKPISLLGDKSSAETLGLTISLLCESIMSLGLNLEVLWYGEGDRQALRNHTRREILEQNLPTMLMYMAAMIVAAVSFSSRSEDEYVGYNDDNYGDKGAGNLYGGSIYDVGYNGTSYASNGTTSHDVFDKNGTDAHGDRFLGAAATSTEVKCGAGRLLYRFLGAAEVECAVGDHRLLGAETEDCACYLSKGAAAETGVNWSIADLPLGLLCLAYLLNIIWTFVRKMRLANRTDDIRDNFVPNNIDYMIHRYGEWIILMIGESVLSLLIVETIESEHYYTIASLGVLTVIILQALKFESQPAHTEGHALYRNVSSGILFGFLIQVLSMALIAFGVTYKIMLTTVYNDAYDELHRNLAAVPAVTNQATAALFSASLTIVLVSLEFMLAAHKGPKAQFERLFDKGSEHSLKSLNLPLLIVSIFKFALIIFIATLSQWKTNLTAIAVIGFLAVLAVAVTRIVVWGIVHKKKEIKEILQSMSNRPHNAAQTMRRLGSAVREAASTHSRRSRGDHSLGESTAADEDEIGMDKALWDTSFDAIIVCEKGGIIRHVNTTALTEFGYKDTSELVGNNISMLVGGGEASNHHKYLDRFAKQHKSSSTIGKQRALYSRRKDGSEFPCIIGIKQTANEKLLVGYVRNMEGIMGSNRLPGNTHPLLRNPDDQLATGVTPEERLIDDESFDAIIIIDPKGIIKHVNATAVTDFGFSSKEDFIGKNISTLVGGGEAQYHDMYLERFREGGKSASTIGKQRVLRSRRKDGSQFPCIIAIKKVPESTNGNLVGYIRNMGAVGNQDKLLKEKTEYLVDDTSFDAIIVTDQKGVIQDVNVTTLDVFGYRNKQELVGLNVSLLVGGGQARYHDRYMERFEKKHKEDSTIGKQRVLYSKRKNGSEFPALIGIRKIPDSDYLIGYIRSMEGKTKKQKALEADQMTRMSLGTTSRGSASVGTPGNSEGSGSVGSNGDILDESFDAIVVTDFHGVIKRVNQTTLDTFRYNSKEELVGKNISLLVGGGEATRHDQYLKRFQDLGKESSKIGKQRVLYSKRKDGTEFPCIIVIKKSVKNNCLIGWIRDMSELTEAKGSFKITNMQLLDPVERLIDDSAFDAIIVTDYHGIIKRVNQTAVNEFKYETKEELEGQNISMLVGGKDAKHHDKFLARFQKTGKSSSTIGKQRVLKSKRKDGTEFRCIIGINRIPETELLVGYIRNVDVLKDGSRGEIEHQE